MLRVVRSEWTKLWRPGQLLGSWGTMAGFVLLLTILLLANAKPEVAANQTASQRGPPSLSFAAFETSKGAVFSFQSTGQLLGIICLVIAAASIATEYTAGTLKVLLVREPRRPVLLGGKLVGLALFCAAGITIALAAAVGASAALAAGRGIDTSQWWTAGGIGNLLQAWANVTMAGWVWMLFGAVLALAFRSGFPAIGIGIAYPLIVEGLLGLVPHADKVVQYMPGRALGALVSGSTGRALGDTAARLSYTAALLMALVYAVGFLAISMGLLSSRDVA